MISFYPGPSRVYEEIPSYIKDAYRGGILSMNHRSAECMHLMKQTIRELKRKLRIPAGYTILFTSSATECWEVIAQSLINTKSIHIGNGAFAQKWYVYTKALNANTEYISFGINEVLNPDKTIFDSANLICLTQNETSTGTQVSDSILKKIKALNPDSLIAVDATSSMGGITLNFSSADIWFASVQKCFGLPAGLAVLICSPRAVKRALEIGESNHYNSLINQLQMAEKFQTTHTPNVLGIYLLYRVMQNSPTITQTHARVVAQAKKWYSFFDSHASLKTLIQNPNAKSHTVITVTATPPAIKAAKARARKAGILLGAGYGNLKETTFRIANFPAIKPAEINKLIRCLR